MLYLSILQYCTGAMRICSFQLVTCHFPFGTRCRSCSSNDGVVISDERIHTFQKRGRCFGSNIAPEQRNRG